jgi:pimeloyl-ACP methyl ester carboxylesterase
MSRTTTVDVEDGRATLEVVLEGGEPSVVLLPSAQRSASDFAQLARDLAAVGYGSAAVNARGVGRSTGWRHDLTLRDIADDVAAVVRAVGDGPMHVVGHALGNVFARATAAYRPDVVRTVTLLACGGHDPAHVSLVPELAEDFRRCTDDTVPSDVRRRSLESVFFAPGNDASTWLSGWWPSGDLRSVFERSVPAEWATAGHVAVLVVQPLEDRLCPPAVGRDLRRRLGDRGRYVEVPRCGHAMLPEQPAAIAEAVIGFLEAHTRGTVAR